MTENVTGAAGQGESPSRLARLPFSIFATIMGLSGLAIATEKVEQHYASVLPVSHILTAIAVFLFIFLSILQMLRLIRHGAALKAEWRHPVRISFFPAASIGLLLISIAILPHHKDISLYVWAVGTVLQFTLSFLVINTWINATRFEPHHVNPAWFIPAVGNVIVPIAGMAHGFEEAAPR